MNEMEKEQQHMKGNTGGYRVSTTRRYSFGDDDGFRRIRDIMKMFRYGFRTIGRLEVEKVTEHGTGLDGIPDVEYLLAGGSSLLIHASEAEPELKADISIVCGNSEDASAMEKAICGDLENIIYMEDRMGYCCE
jgi:hypothetical protein